MTRKAIVLASLNRDITIEVESLPSPGETILGQTLRSSWGGKGGNQAVAIARLGGQVTVLGAVGADESGRDYISSLRHEGISTARILEHPTSPTGTAMICVDQTGQNSIIVVPGANFECNEEAILSAAAEIRSASVLVSQLEIPLNAILKAFDIAKAAGVLTVLNPAPWRSNADKLFPLADIIIPNEVEFAQVFGISANSSDLELINSTASVLDSGTSAIIVTLGAAGAMSIVKDCVTRYPAKHVKAIDTTAAGDSFVGGFTWHLMRNESGSFSQRISSAIQWGILCGGLAVQKVGAQASIPYLIDLT